MKKIRFTHKIMVPNDKRGLDEADGYVEEMADVKLFELSQEEYEDLRKAGGLFDAFDANLGTIIDDCEEDRITEDQVLQAITITKQFMENKDLNQTSGAAKVLLSLEHAKEKGVFWEIVNGAETYE